MSFYSSDYLTKAREKVKAISNSGTLPEPVSTTHPKYTGTVTESAFTTCVIDADTISAAINEHKQNPSEYIGVLNFASYKYPGGGYVTGAMAQEECLCYDTNLYYELCKYEPEYEMRRLDLNNGLYRNKGIYSRGISVIASRPGIFLAPEDRFVIDVFTCAAPNLNYMIRQNRADSREVIDTIYSRADYVVQSMAQYPCDTLILGAFGCGVFRNDASIVAQAFKKALESCKVHGFKKVIFAIPGNSTTNYIKFKNVFG